jgi:peptide chain release factor 2
MFSGQMDAANAFMDIQAGSGGTEAQDWANMLLRMYLRWGERHGFKTELMELSEGEVAGIKSATIKFTGEYVYGYLRTETGVHRLVRKSPFDSGHRRHTSFASVFIYPEVDDSVDIDIKPADLRIDTYRASGAGGQHVNRTDSAVRITHVPTGIVVQCQSDRSQHKNKAAAMAVLKSRLYEHEMQKRRAEQQKLEGSKADISWGSQIRSYVLDQSRIKDLRTGVESGNPTAVLDGDLAFVFKWKSFHLRTSTNRSRNDARSSPSCAHRAMPSPRISVVMSWPPSCMQSTGTGIRQRSRPSRCGSKWRDV